jgi:hypothetical protein
VGGQTSQPTSSYVVPVRVAANAIVPFAATGGGAVGARVIPTFDAVTVTVAVFETVFVAESTALIEIGLDAETGARNVA